MPSSPQHPYTKLQSQDISGSLAQSASRTDTRRPRRLGHESDRGQIFLLPLLAEMCRTCGNMRAVMLSQALVLCDPGFRRFLSPGALSRLLGSFAVWGMRWPMSSYASVARR